MDFSLSLSTYTRVSGNNLVMVSLRLRRKRQICFRQSEKSTSVYYGRDSNANSNEILTILTLLIIVAFVTGHYR